MLTIDHNRTRPKLRIKRFSTLHIELFERLLYSGKTNWDLNLEYGYTKRSHCIVDHTRKVMYKLLAAENLSKEDHKMQVIYPRTYHLWWKRLLDKHKQTLMAKAVPPVYYDEAVAIARTAYKPVKRSGTWNYYLT